MPHRRAARKLASYNWLRWELASVAVFHLGMAAVLAFGPNELVINGATWAILYYLHRTGMAAAFLVVGVLAVICYWRPRPLVQLALWVLLYMLGVGWLTGFAFAVHRGNGGLYGLVVWAVLLMLWVSTAVRLGLGNGGTGVVDRGSNRRARQ